MFFIYRPALPRGVWVGCLPSPQHLSQPPDWHQWHQQWSVPGGSESWHHLMFVFQWAAAAGGCGCGQWTSRAAGERAWTACAARTTGGSTRCPVSTPGRSESRIVTVFLNVMSLFRILHIAVSSIHKEVLSYKVSWITSGPLKPDSLQFQVSVFTIFDVCLLYSVFAICLSGTLLPQMPKVVWKF